MYKAELHPTKLELLNAWLPTRPWYRGTPTPDFDRESAFRFDDPAGEVGVETLLVRAGDGPLFQVPLTYRGAPLDGAQQWLVGTTDHSVLGKRWVYDACGDPVYLSTLATTIRTGAGEAAEFIHTGGEPQSRKPSMTVRGSGTPGTDVAPITALIRVDDADPTVIVVDSFELSVRRILDDTAGSSSEQRLTGTWANQPTPLVLATLRTV